MAFNSNPMGISGAPSNYQQPSTGNPASQAAVASYDIGWNVLGLTWPIAKYTQPNYAAPASTPAFPLGGTPRFVLLQ